MSGCNDVAVSQEFPASAETTEEVRPYTLAGTQVWAVPDPVSGLEYEVFVSLPTSYDQQSNRTYPVLYVTDADYAFPVIRSITKRVREDGKVLEDFILVGLSYAKGETGRFSRNRDYTPTPAGGMTDKSGIHGEAAAYYTYLKGQVLPDIEQRFRADPGRRVYMGHSYGGLLGAQMMFADPGLFNAYILGSPSFWYDDGHMLKEEARYAKDHRDLPAALFIYIGEFETVRLGDRRYHQNMDMDMVADMQAFEQQLRSRSYPNLTISSDVVAEENHLTVFPSGLTRGLMHIFPAER